MLVEVGSKSPGPSSRARRWAGTSSCEKCPAGLIGQQPADQLPWFHLVTLLTKVSADTEREWYAAQVIQHGWSRSTLDVHIKNRLHLRQGGAITNFARHLPTPDAQLAIEALKDPHLFDFLGLGDEAHERDIENALIRHITRFLLELGVGFAFVGRQFRLEVNRDESFIDLLFYHTRLKCYVVVELKGVAFKPEHADQLNFYLAAVDAQIKAPDDEPTIGLLLCKTENRLAAEYALSGISKPIGVAEYQGELDPVATIRSFRIVQTEGTRDVFRAIDHYSIRAMPRTSTDHSCVCAVYAQALRFWHDSESALPPPTLPQPSIRPRVDLAHPHSRSNRHFTFHKYLECGLLCHGFARLHCSGCGQDYLVALTVTSISTT